METINSAPESVIIGGRFAWALAKTLAERHPDWSILFIMRDQAKIEEARALACVDLFFGDKIRKLGRPNTLERIKMPANVSFHSISEFNTRFRGTIQHLFIPGISSNYIRGVLKDMNNSGVPESAFHGCEVLAVSKGMENATLKQPHEIIDEVLNVNSVVALGGNLAFEFALGDPMLMELSGLKSSTARIAGFFLGSNLMIYETKNRRKLALAGPMKNIHSLATGMASEVFGKSSVSAVATLGLSEYEHAAFIVQFPEKLRGLARKIQKFPFNFRSVPIAGGAMSDYHLFRFTRNFEAGQEFVRLTRQGKTAQQAMAIISKSKTVESFSSAAPTRVFLKQAGAVSPVIEMMDDILSGKISAEAGISRVLQQHNIKPS